MSRIEDLMDLEQSIEPDILERMYQADKSKSFTAEEQERILLLACKKMAVLQAAEENSLSENNCSAQEPAVSFPAKKQQDTEKKTEKRFAKKWCLLTAALVCAVILSLSTAAIAMFGTDSHLLQVLHADSQSQINKLNEMSTELGQSVMADGYTVTLREVVHDSYHLWMLLDVTAPEGVVLKEDTLSFWEQKLQFEQMGGLGYSLYTLPDEQPEDNWLELVLDVTTQHKLSEQQITLELAELGAAYGEGQWELYAKGPWKFSFALPNDDHTVTVGQWKLLQHKKLSFLLTKIDVSPLSVRLSTKRLRWDAYIDLQEERLQVYCKDGTVLTLEQSGSGSSGIGMVFYYDFPAPMDLAQIARIVYCGEELSW